ncbi:hypothetical protein QBC36DRAFT_105414 [Triangularia setosa]|uniref:Uncharacterized protein n=1 Tax=Triangularia setosa TaxID=2587417 RepID=A0AAN6WE06_9PEZI|nr:hypothetical protein QBC36DRAFT_105414 [Podospora setosa]
MLMAVVVIWGMMGSYSQLVRVVEAEEGGGRKQIRLCFVSGQQPQLGGDCAVKAGVKYGALLHEESSSPSSPSMATVELRGRDVWCSGLPSQGVREISSRVLPDMAVNDLSRPVKH